MQRTTEVTSTSLDFEDGDSERSGAQQNVPIRETAIEVNEKTKEVLSAEAAESNADPSEQQLELTEEASTPSSAQQQALAKQVAEDLREEIEDGAIEIEALGQQLIIRVREKGAFPAGSAFLQPRFRPVITKIANILVDIPGVVTVAGHTDNEPVQSELYRSNLDLSAQRAVSVAQEMLKVDGIRAKKMLVVGYANSKPLAEGNSTEAQNRNRRVEIMIMQGEASESDEISVE